VQPPTIVIFVNDPKAFPHTYRRYLLGVFRDQLPYGEVPIKLYLQSRTQKEDGADSPDELPSGDDEMVSEA
jgi:GTP-binding protein